METWAESKWTTVAPSELPLGEDWPTLLALSEDEINKVILSFASSAHRAARVGFKALEIHGAHGYLIHSFLSKVTNLRNDQYGGDLEGRMRFALEVTEAVRENWPDNLPLFFRLSAIDGNGWEIEDSITLSKELKKRGVDVIDCSAGGITSAPAFRTNDDGTPMKSSSDRPLGFQVPYSEKIRNKADILTMAVGRIIYPEQAEDILQNQSADLTALGRELMHDPFWTLHAADHMNVDNPFELWPEQYRWAIVRRAELENYRSKS